MAGPVDCVLRKRVLIILPSFDSGGSENFALRLIEFAGHTQHEWHVTSGNLINRSLEKSFSSAGAYVHYASPGFASPLKSLRFYRFLKMSNFNTVISLIGVFGGPSLALARLAGVKNRLAWHRRSTPAYAKTPIRRLYANGSLALLNWAATRVLSNSQAALEQYHGQKWSRSNTFELIPNGIDAERFKPRVDLACAIRHKFAIPKDAFVVGHVGRVDPAKDHDTLLKSISQLRNIWPDLRLLLVGTGTDSLEFQNRLRENNVNDITTCLGVREDIHDVYQAMDLFFFPSVTEGQPNALLEAVMSNLPIVASDIPTIREALPAFLHDQLFEPRNFQHAVRAIIKLRSSSNELEQQARAWAAHRYDPARNFSRLLELIQS